MNLSQVDQPAQTPDRIQAGPVRLMQLPSGRQLGVLLIVSAAVVAGGVLRAHAPGALHLPSCPFHQFTGFYCPGCGSTRALHHLLNFEFAAALRCNFMFVVLSPFLALWFGAKGLRILNLWHGRDFDLSVRTTRLLIAITIAWWIVRNLPLPWFTIPLQ
ncbi:DUF2752 domain-containing protein [Acidicapsa ligni]|uniref:DUF2752 domain-containing protein n=1 Tax=Acidicapsa ligni TaxID=542300 RepID=UPI0021E0B04F|nr:DUF2752 domain-containing protein [Acidicapsa ligni]